MRIFFIPWNHLCCQFILNNCSQIRIIIKSSLVHLDIALISLCIFFLYHNHWIPISFYNKVDKHNELFNDKTGHSWLFCEEGVSLNRTFSQWVRSIRNGLISHWKEYFYFHKYSFDEVRSISDNIFCSFLQFISKADWRAIDSPKKPTDEFVLFAFLLFTANKSNSLVRFLGESTVRQSAVRNQLTFSKTLRTNINIICQ